MLNRNQHKSVSELSETELRLTRLSVHPVTNIRSLTAYYTNIKVKKIIDKKQVSGYPKNTLLSRFNWLPDQSMIACLNTTVIGIEVWVLHIAEAKESIMQTL